MPNGPKASIGDDLRIELARPCDRVALVSDAQFAAYRRRLLEFLFLEQRAREPATSVRSKCPVPLLLTSP